MQRTILASVAFGWLALVAAWSVLALSTPGAHAAIGDCEGDETNYLNAKCSNSAFCRGSGCVPASLTCPDGATYHYAKYTTISSYGTCSVYSSGSCKQCQVIYCATGNMWSFFNGQCQIQKCGVQAGVFNSCI